MQSTVSCPLNVSEWYLVDCSLDILMIRVLALYSQGEHNVFYICISSIDRVAARRLAWILKTFLGFEAIIDLAFMIYGTVVEESEIHNLIHN